MTRRFVVKGRLQQRHRGGSGSRGELADARGAYREAAPHVPGWADRGRGGARRLTGAPTDHSETGDFVLSDGSSTLVHDW
jgi:hypothetical protein